MFPPATPNSCQRDVCWSFFSLVYVGEASSSDFEEPRCYDYAYLAEQDSDPARLLYTECPRAHRRSPAKICNFKVVMNIVNNSRCHICGQAANVAVLMRATLPPGMVCTDKIACQEQLANSPRREGERTLSRTTKRDLRT